MASRYWVGGTGNWSDNTNHWSASSGGAPNASLPASSDDVFINSSSGLSGGTITTTNIAYCNNFVSTTGISYTIAVPVGVLLISGSLTLESGITFSANSEVDFDGTSVGLTLTTAGVIIPTIQFYGVGGSWILQDNLICTGQFYQENGIFNANGHNVTAHDFYFYANIGFTPTFIMSTGTFSPIRSTWTLDENNGVLVNIIPPPAPPSVSPTVTTQAVSSIANTTATGNGTVTDSGDSTVTARGVVFSQFANPTLLNNTATTTGTTGAFTASMTGLTAGTLYHVRAYATNTAGTSYGADVTFTSTNEPPTPPTATGTSKKIDENDKPALLAYNETTGLVEYVRVDPVLGALEVFGVTPDSNTPTAINRAFIDGNDNSTLTAYNDTTGLIEALRCGSNGELLITQ